VFSDYAMDGHQPILRMKISNGAACGPDKNFAIYRGLCEIAERDSYMNCFISNMPLNKINFKNDPEMSRFIRRITRYDIEVHCLNTSLDTSVFTTACFLLDRTGSGPAVCTGIGGSMSPQRAVKMAVYEALRRHVLARDWFFSPKPNSMPPVSSVHWFLAQKQLIWSAPHMIKYAQKYLHGANIYFDQIVRERSKLLSHLTTDKEKADYLVEEFNRIGCEAIYVDVTTPEISAIGLSVVRVLVPEMVPLSRDGRYPYLGVRRLNQFSEKYPHTKQPDKEIDMFTEHPF
jgi:ribosomal protein S12 methylthiotransferase accessory factor